MILKGAAPPRLRQPGGAARDDRAPAPHKGTNELMRVTIACRLLRQ
jgi:hypothetical protein